MLLAPRLRAESLTLPRLLRRQLVYLPLERIEPPLRFVRDSLRLKDFRSKIRHIGRYYTSTQARSGFRYLQDMAQPKLS